jgi:RNA polymerase sigma factor (sigma-70 family)
MPDAELGGRCAIVGRARSFPRTIRATAAVDMWMEPTSEQLMVEMGWVRRLARALLHDTDAADDIVQETWLVAASQQPDEERPLRPWLARVVRNLARTRRRGTARRDEREAAYEDASGRAVATPAELIERVELQRVVAGEVLALAEPYRSTVLLHFFEGLTSAQIARRLGIPDGTVRRRLKTALDQLRAQLQARNDQPDRGWLAALAPLAKGAEPAAPPSTFLGALIVKKIIAIAVVLVLFVAGALVWKFRGGDGRSVPAATASQTKQLHPVGAGRELGRVPEWATQAGAPARRIAGHVVFDGAPVAGATVRLGLQISGDLVRPLAELTSTADGAFDFGLQAAAQFTVSAQAESHSSAAVAVANADPRAKVDQLVVVLGGDCRARVYGGARMYGTVSDASGGSISKAYLSIDGLAGTNSDAAGHYSLCLSPIDDVDTPQAIVRIAADGYGTTTQRVIVAGELRQDFVMVPEAVLAGRVVTADDRPVPGARVLAEPDAIEGPHHVASNWAESDGDGHFRIAGLAPGKFHLSATARSAGSSVPLIAIARATTTSRELRLVLAPLARVTGRVIMGSAPVAGAHVAIVRPDTDPGPQPSATSQADGTFTLDGVPFGTVAISAAPFSVNTPKTLDVKRAQINGVLLDVGKLATVRGHVLRKGKPVPGAEVRFMPLAPPLMLVKTDADGAFVLEGQPAGDGRLYAWSVQSKAASVERLVHLKAGEDHTEDIELELAGEVKGTVVDEASKPVPGVYVRMDGDGNFCEAMTDEGGDFDCALVAGGEYAPKVAPSASAGQEFAPAVGDKLAMITVPKDGVVTGVRLAIKHQNLSIRGIVVDDTGIAVSDVHVEAIGHGYVVMTDLASVMTDTNGKFEIGNLARGTYNLHAHASDGSETEVLGISTAGDPVTIKLARPGAIQGTLVGFSTTPLVETNTLTADLHISSNAIVEGNTFSQVGMPPGRYTVEAKVGLETDGVAVDVRSGETTRVTLTSRGTGRVEGTVIEFGTKAPVAGMRCDGNLSMGGQMGPSAPDESRQAFTDAAGHFSLATPTGHVRVFCFNPMGGLLSVAGTDVDVAPGSVPRVDLVSVRAAFGGSPPLLNVGFDLLPLNLPLTVNTVDPTGPAASAGIAPGDHLITIDSQSLQGMLPQGAAFMLLNHHPGSTITLALERGGAARTAKIVVR